MSGKQNPLQHDLYRSGDPDVPEGLKDSNGDMPLAVCRTCGRGEIELEADDGVCPGRQKTAEESLAEYYCFRDFAANDQEEAVEISEKLQRPFAGHPEQIEPAQATTCYKIAHFAGEIDRFPVKIEEFGDSDDCSIRMDWPKEEGKPRISVAFGRHWNRWFQDIDPVVPYGADERAKTTSTRADPGPTFRSWTTSDSLAFHEILNQLGTPSPGWPDHLKPADAELIDLVAKWGYRVKEWPVTVTEIEKSRALTLRMEWPELGWRLDLPR